MLKKYTFYSAQIVFSSYVLFSLSIGWAQPSQPTVIEGKAHIEQIDSQTTQITTGHQTKIEWKDFSIASHETTRFIQPQASSVVINQVTGLYPSDILGKLEASGRVYLINPAGIFIGPDALIQTAGFIATTFDQLSLDKDGGAIHFKGNSKAPIRHLGQIETAGGSVMLVAAHLENLGKIEGNEVHIIASPEVWIKPSEEGAYLIPQVSLQQIQESSDPMEFVIQQKGLIRATEFRQEKGRIYLISKDKTEVEGEIFAEGGSVAVLGKQVALLDHTTIDVSSFKDAGQILIGGDYQGKNHEILNAKETTVGKDAILLANGGERGSGGRVILWGDQVCDFQGKIEAQGGKVAGDGGFVEVSSPFGLNFRGCVNLKSPHGKFGMLYLDPFDVIVQPNGNVNEDIATSGSCPGGITYQSTLSSGGVVDNTVLAAALNNCNVTLLTPPGSGGNVYVFERIAGWTQPTTLIIQADGSVFWNWDAVTTAHFTQASQGSLNITANSDINFQIPPGETNAQLGFHTGTGTITLNAGGSVLFDDGQTTGSNNHVGLMSEQGAIQITAAQLQAISGGPSTGGISIGLSSDMFNDNFFGNVVSSPITFDISGDVQLTANESSIQIGHHVLTDSLTSISNAPIIFTNIGGNFSLQVTEGAGRVGHRLTTSAGTGPSSMTDCNILFNNIGLNALIEGNNSFVSIGHQTCDPTYVVDSSIEVQNVGGSFTLQDTSPAPFISVVNIGHNAAVGGLASDSFILGGDILIGNETPVQQQGVLMRII